jgi:hypothetical protein
MIRTYVQKKWISLTVEFINSLYKIPEILDRILQNIIYRDQI